MHLKNHFSEVSFSLYTRKSEGHFNFEEYLSPMNILSDDSDINSDYFFENEGREKSDGIEKVEAILASPTTFVRHIAEIGVFGEEGCDDTNARKHWYKKVNVCMRAFINALKVHQGRT